MLTAQYIDTCLPCYLQDSYSREGQTLLYAPLGGTLDETVESLVRSLEVDCGIPLDVDYSDIAGVVKEALNGVDLRAIDAEGNRVNSPLEEDPGDEPYLYVLLEWEEG